MRLLTGWQIFLLPKKIQQAQDKGNTTIISSAGGSRPPGLLPATDLLPPRVVQHVSLYPRVVSIHASFYRRPSRVVLRVVLLVSFYLCHSTVSFYPVPVIDYRTSLT
jgi:hypothetical protein